MWRIAAETNSLFERDAELLANATEGKEIKECTDAEMYHLSALTGAF